MCEQKICSLLPLCNVERDEAAQIELVKFAEQYGRYFIQTLKYIKEVKGKIGQQQISFAYEITNGIKSDKLESFHIQRRQQTIKGINGSHLTVKQLNSQATSPISSPSTVTTVKLSQGSPSLNSSNSQIIKWFD